MQITKSEDAPKASASTNSTYIENALRHRLLADLCSELWRRNCFATLQIFNAEVDNAGFDIVLKLGKWFRYVQLKQAHQDKKPPHCSVRLSFSELAGSCVVLMSYSLRDLSITRYRFFGEGPTSPMKPIREFRPSIAPGRRNADGERHIRHHYRNVPISRFRTCSNINQLFELLFPEGVEQLVAGNDQFPGFEDDEL